MWLPLELTDVHYILGISHYSALVAISIKVIGSAEESDDSGKLVLGIALVHLVSICKNISLDIRYGTVFMKIFRSYPKSCAS